MSRTTGRGRRVAKAAMATMAISTAIVATSAAATTSSAAAGPATTRSRTDVPTRVAEIEFEVVRLTNLARLTSGCGPVRPNRHLATAARLHSADMARMNFFGHIGSDGSDFRTRADRAGYPHALGENVAEGYPTAATVVRGWLESTPHGRLILDCRAKAVGIGVAQAPGGALLWTQVFGRV